MPKVSVLTPIYNVEKYLPQCLDSLISQTMDDIEFICINDGSTDSSLEILKRYASRDSRVVIIDKENGGYGQAMNAGLDSARGEYIGIVESDDFADPHMFEKLYALAKNNNCDIAKTNHYRYDEMLGSSLVRNFPNEWCGSVFRPLDKSWHKVVHTIPAIWAALYRRDFLRDEGIRFNESPGASFQDTGFVYKSWLAAKRVILDSSAYLHYRTDNAGSSVKSGSKVFCVCDEYRTIFDFISKDPELYSEAIKVITAEKFHTYEWNLNRLDGSHRESFIEKMYEEFSLAESRGELEEEAFRPLEWKRLMQLLRDKEEYAAENRLKLQLEGYIKVSVIVPVYNSERYLRDTLNSVLNQTLREIEIVVVDDGSSDGSRDVVREFCKKDRRFRYIWQANQGVGSARNLGLSNAHGKYVAFCDADDVVPPTAYERLYKAAELQNAELAIGEMESFDAFGKTVFPQTRILSTTHHIDRYSHDFHWSLSLCNKLFLRSRIQKKALRFGNSAMTEDGVFLLDYLVGCKRIAGCFSLVYRYRNAPFYMEGTSATHTVSMRMLKDFIASFKTLEQIRSSSVRYDFDHFEEMIGSDIEAQRVQAEMTLCREDLNRRFCSLLIDRYYRYVWLLEDEALSLLRSSYNESIENVFNAHRDSIEYFHRDLRLDLGVRDKAQLIDNPSVSLIVSPAMRGDTLAMMMKSLYSQKFPLFELILPSNAYDQLESTWKSMKNIRVLNCPSRSYLEEAATLAKAPLVSILQDGIYYKDDSLKRLWEFASNSRADFVSCALWGVSFDGGGAVETLKTSRQVFLKKYCGSPSVRTPINELDASPNNKLFKKSALMSIVSSGDTYDLVRTAYETLSFEKLSTKTMVCAEDDAWFFSHASASARRAFSTDNALRYLHSDAFKKKRAKVVKYVKPRFSSKRIIRNQVLFITNRSTGSLPPNLQAVLDRLSDCDCVIMNDPLPHSREYDRRAVETLLSSKVIVTDDYCHYLRTTKLDSKQTFVQLWHACGAFKKFGLDYCGVDISRERKTHSQYDIVSVSSEFVAPIYAHAFGIAPSKIKAWGVPRTDLLLEDGYCSQARASFDVKHPECQGKKLVLYAPTFRQKDGRQINWDTRISWKKFSSELPEDVVVLVKAHPLEKGDILQGLWGNIIDVSHEDTEELIASAHIVMTDYSSIIFDAALLEKHLLLYCPDIDTCDMDYYLRFPQDLECPCITKSEEIVAEIERLLSSSDRSNSYKLKSRYMGACDGHSADRVARFIRDCLNGK